MNRAQQAALMRPFAEEEVQATIKGLNAEGALGPECHSSVFLREIWEQVEVEVMAMLEEF